MWYSTYKTELATVAYKSILYIEGFTVVDFDASTNKKCIQYIDTRGTTYALKVISGVNRPRFEVGKSKLNLNLYSRLVIVICTCLFLLYECDNKGLASDRNWKLCMEALASVEVIGFWMLDENS